MAPCPQCGAALPPGARYCTSCGTAAVLPTLPAGSATFPAGPAPGAQPVHRDTGLAQGLLLVGAFLGAILPALAALLMLLLGALLAAVIPFWGAIPGALIGLAGLALGAVGLVWALVVWHARNRIAGGDPQGGGMLAMLAGAFMVVLGVPLLAFPAIAGLIVLAGGFLAYTAR